MHDEKFIDIFMDKFFQEGITNKLIILKKNSNYAGKHKKNVECIVSFSKEYLLLLKQIRTYDFVFIYNLDYDKAYLINHVEKTQSSKFIWNFFGTEIYNNSYYPFLEGLYDYNTRKLLKTSTGVDIKKYLRVVKYLLKGRKVPDKEILCAIKNMDFFAWYSEEEYNYLKVKVKHLPPFLNYPLDNFVPALKPVQSNEIKLLLGNSRSPENNHLDILLLLKGIGFQGNITIPFSYGSDLHYANGLKKSIKSLKMKIRLLEGFLPYNEYISEVSSCNIAIYNSFRQMALGNIIVSLVSGAKVYLSERNISYVWLKRLEFNIYSIENDLKRDLENKNIYLESDKKLENQNLYSGLTSRKNIEIFIKGLWDMDLNINNKNIF